MKYRKARYNVIGFWLIIILTIGCDPIGKIIFSNNLNSQKYDSLEINFDGYAVGNISFRLMAHIKSQGELTIYTDSLVILHSGKSINYRTYLEGILLEYEESIINLYNDSTIVLYSFDLTEDDIGDEIKIFARKYFKRDDGYINLDTLTFSSPKLNFPLFP